MANNLSFIQTQFMQGMASAFATMVAQSLASEVAKIIEASKPKFYSRKEVAELLHISLPTLRAYVNTGRLNCRKVEGRVLFPAEEIDLLVGHNDVKYKRGGKA